MKRTLVIYTVFACLCLSVLPTGSVAQTNNKVANAFAGQWTTYDRRHSAQGQCSLQLSAVNQNGIYPIKPSNCVDVLANIRGWAIRNNQLVFVDGKGSVLAAVGGNQERISGMLLNSKLPIILEKADIAEKVSRVRKSIRCSYVGYSQTCAKPRQFAPPAIGTNGSAPVSVLVNLNMRVEPRSNAKILTVLKPKACVQASFCSLASDGLWCQVKADEVSGWIKKQAVRQKQWPIVTFTNGC